MNLYLFNPENDLAIAFGGENYTPPPAAQLIGKELSALPLWYADDDTTIYIPDKLPSDFLHTLAPLNLKNFYGNTRPARWSTSKTDTCLGVEPRFDKTFEISGNR